MNTFKKRCLIGTGTAAVALAAYAGWIWSDAAVVSTSIAANNAAAGTAGAPSVSGPDTLHLVAADNPETPAGRALTTDECGRYRTLLDSSAALLTADIEPGDASARAVIDAAVARSRAWMDKGCPADGVRGVFPSADGKGEQVKLLDINVVQLKR